MKKQVKFVIWGLICLLCAIFGAIVGRNTGDQYQQGHADGYSKGYGDGMTVGGDLGIQRKESFTYRVENLDPEQGTASLKRYTPPIDDKVFTLIQFETKYGKIKKEVHYSDSTGQEFIRLDFTPKEK